MTHEAPVGKSVEWYTPPELFDRLGTTFDLDPAHPKTVTYVPARKVYTAEEDGTQMPWRGRVWLNPPYGKHAIPFVNRMLEHRNGLMLLPARTETALFQAAGRNADIVCFLRDRLHFIRPDGYQARAAFGSVLFAYGWDNADIVAKADLGWTVP